MNKGQHVHDRNGLEWVISCVIHRAGGLRSAGGLRIQLVALGVPDWMCTECSPEYFANNYTTSDPKE